MSRSDPRRFCATVGHDVSTPVEPDVDWEFDHQEMVAEDRPFASLREVAEWWEVRGTRWERRNPDPYNDYSQSEGTFEEDPQGVYREYTAWLVVKRCSGLPLTFAEAVRLDRLVLEDRKWSGALVPADEARYNAERTQMIFDARYGRYRQRILP